eukprot:2128742-Ditylum_brightwellii.AAC.1
MMKKNFFEDNEEELSHSNYEPSGSDEDTSLEADLTLEPTTGLCRTTQERIPNQQYCDYYAHLQTKFNTEEYSTETAQIIGM